jgi:hypothetical protein
MTRITNLPTKCKCGNVVDVVLHNSVNVSRNPELLEKIKEREINNFFCEECGEFNELAYPFLYVEYKGNLWIRVYPTAAKNNEMKIRKEIGMEKGFFGKIFGDRINENIELVFGYDELFQRLNKI